jgi:hypothetical protein
LKPAQRVGRIVLRFYLGRPVGFIGAL